MESYLNSIWLGESNYGVKAAAMDYFGKNLDELTLKECAMLAGLIKNPSAYNPRRNYYQRNTPDVTDKRTERALYAMLESNYITQDEYNRALAEPLNIVEESTINQLYQMPYAVETVLDDVTTAFLAMRGLPDTSTNRSAIRREIRSNGYNIYSTIDPEVQLILEDVIYNGIPTPRLPTQATPSSGRFQATALSSKPSSRRPHRSSTITAKASFVQSLEAGSRHAVFNAQQSHQQRYARGIFHQAHCRLWPRA